MISTFQTIQEFVRIEQDFDLKILEKRDIGESVTLTL